MTFPSKIKHADVFDHAHFEYWSDWGYMLRNKNRKELLLFDLEGIEFLKKEFPHETILSEEEIEKLMNYILDGTIPTKNIRTYDYGVIGALVSNVKQMVENPMEEFRQLNQKPIRELKALKQTVDQDNIFYWLLFSRHPIDVLRMSDHKKISSCHNLKNGMYKDCAFLDGQNNGGDLLFNFDYALMANVFGYDLMGTRNVTGKAGYDLLTYHMARSFVEHSRKMLRYISYQFDPKTQYLRLTPSPPVGSYGSCCNTGGMADYNNGAQCYMVGLYVEPPIEECLSEYWVREYVLARAMQTLGLIRSKFGGVTLFGGQTLEGSVLLDRGTSRVETLMKELRQDNFYNPPSMFFIH